MNILFLTHRLPYPPTDGARIRAFHCIRHFSQQGHKVTVASLARSDKEFADGQGLADYCDRMLIEQVNPLVQNVRMVSRLLRPSPSSMGYFRSRRLMRRIHEALRKTQFDLIFVHCSSVAPYVSQVTSIPKFLDFVDMDSQKWLDIAAFKSFPKSSGYRLEGTKMARAERELSTHFDMNTVVTAGEHEVLESFANPAGTSDWFPNGVDSEVFRPDDSSPDSDTLVFTGRMDYFPNASAMQWFCDEVLPQLQQTRPSVKLLIVGADPSDQVKRLAGRPGVIVTGTVDEVQPYLRRAQISIAPLQIARGTQNKVIEAMAMGIPVVANSMTAKGVDAIPGEHLLVADSPRQWRDTLLTLLDDESERQRLSIAGRERVLSNHSWDYAMARLDTLVEACISNFAARKL